MANADISTTDATRSRVEAFHAQMLERASQFDEDRAEQVMLAQAARIFDAAESGKGTAAILSADMGGTIQGRDVPGTVWELRGFDVVRSNRTDIANAHGYYLSFDAVYLGGPKDTATKNGLTIGEPYALQTGADLVVFKAAALLADDAYPVRVSLVGTTTGSGRTLLRLTEAPDTVS